jgi:hypothetical protein
MGVNRQKAAQIFSVKGKGSVVSEERGQSHIFTYFQETSVLNLGV